MLNSRLLPTEMVPAPDISETFTIFTLIFLLISVAEPSETVGVCVFSSIGSRFLNWNNPTLLGCKQNGSPTSPLPRNGELEWVCCPGRDRRRLGSVGIGRGLATLHKHLASLVFFFLLWSPCYVLSISWCCYSMQALPACNLRSGDLNCQRLSGMSMISASDPSKTAIVVKALRQIRDIQLCRACKIYSDVLTWRQSQRLHKGP